MISKPIQKMTYSELLDLSGTKSRSKIVLTRLIRFIILEASKKILTGIYPLVDGNIRTFFYTYVKPVLAKIEEDERIRTSSYDIMLDIFVELISRKKVFKYKDLGFYDEYESHRIIGDRNPGLLLISEKSSMFRILKKIQKRFGISIFALRGAPSHLSSEYFADELEIEGIKSLDILGICDFNPSGDIIFNSLVSQLRNQGIEIRSAKQIIIPKYLEMYIDVDEMKYPVKNDKLTEKWINSGGGVGGAAYALEVESLKNEEIFDLAVKKVERFLEFKPQ